MILENNFSFFNNDSSESRRNISTKINYKLKYLALSSGRYKNFIDSTTNSEERSPHHLPKISTMRHSESQKTLEKNIKNIDNIVLPYKNPIKNKRIQPFFISELNCMKTREKKLELKKINLVKLKKLIKFPGTVQNVYKRSINILPSFKKRIKEKQIFYLLDSIFPDKNQEDDNEIKGAPLKYEEEKILGHKNKYLEYLKKELNLLHKGEKALENKLSISYEYNNKIYGKIKLELNSANILITNKEDGEKYCSIDLPFCFLCLLFLSQFKELNYIILGLFRNEKIIENNQENLLNELNNIIMNQISFKNYILKYNNDINEEDRKTVFEEYLNKKNQKNRLNVKYNFLTLFSKKEAFKHTIFKNCTYNIYSTISNNNDTDIENDNVLHSDNTETLKMIFDTHINIINISWMSLNHNYNIKISMPKIKIYFEKFKKEINHFINKELLVYIMMNDFKNFNFYVIHYLFTLKKFRETVYKALSYNNLYKLNPLLIRIINNENSISNLKYEKYNISNIRFEEFENSLNDNEYSFYVSDEDKFHLFKLKSYTLFIYSLDSLEDTKNSKIFFFNFSFHHMKVLFYKSKYDNLLQFIQRLLKYNPITKNIFFDYNFFSSFKNMTTDQIDFSFKETSFNTIKNVKNVENEITYNDLVLRLLEPKFISVSINKINEKNLEGEKKVGNVGEKLITKLMENDIKNWSKILWENRDDIEPLKKKRNKKISFKGKKDFKNIFKKFLKIN